MSGYSGENVATSWLKSEGYTIRHRNWRTKFCEIDIVAEKADTLYFIEVKHRKNSQQGDGLSAITACKLLQMQFAAQVYISFEHITGTDIQLGVMTATGDTPIFELFLRIE